MVIMYVCDECKSVPLGKKFIQCVMCGKKFCDSCTEGWVIKRYRGKDYCCCDGCIGNIVLGKLRKGDGCK